MLPLPVTTGTFSTMKPVLMALHVTTWSMETTCQYCYILYSEVCISWTCRAAPDWCQLSHTGSPFWSPWGSLAPPPLHPLPSQDSRLLWLASAPPVALLQDGQMLVYFIFIQYRQYTLVDHGKICYAVWIIKLWKLAMNITKNTTTLQHYRTTEQCLLPRTLRLVVAGRVRVGLLQVSRLQGATTV